MALALGMGGMVSRARLRYTRDFMTPGKSFARRHEISCVTKAKCDLINPAAMGGKMMSFHREIYTAML